MAKKECFYPNCGCLIAVEEYQLHIAYCRLKQNSEICRCPYSSIHIIPKQEFEYHCENCPNRADAERFRQQFEQSNRQPTQEIVGTNTSPVVEMSRRKQLVEVASFNDLFPTVRSSPDYDLSVTMQISKAN